MDSADGFAVARPSECVRSLGIGLHALLPRVAGRCSGESLRSACARARRRGLSHRRHDRARAPGRFGRGEKKGAQQIGRSRGGPSTKIHALVDALGNPVRLALSEGQTHEMKLAYELLGSLKNAIVIADSAYDARPLAQMLEANGCTVVIPSNPTHVPQRGIDRYLYRERHLVEGFFQRIKRFRRIAMRFEKLARNFLAFVHLAAILVWLV